jgi:hypothetical protein
MALGNCRRDCFRGGDFNQACAGLTPARLRLCPRSAARWALGLSLGIPALLSLPFGVPRVPIWKSLGQFIYVARVNDAFWWIVEETFWPNPHQKNYSYNLVIVIAGVVVALLFFWNWRRGVFWSLGTALILSPVLHPWYVTWILPLAVWRRVDAWQVLSVTIFAYYLFWDERLFRLPWHSDPWSARFYFPPADCRGVGRSLPSSRAKSRDPVNLPESFHRGMESPASPTPSAALRPRLRSG